MKISHYCRSYIKRGAYKCRSMTRNEYFSTQRGEKKKIMMCPPAGYFLPTQKSFLSNIHGIFFTSISSLLNLQLSCFFANFPAGISILSSYLDDFERLRWSDMVWRGWMHILCSYSVRIYKWKILSSGEMLPENPYKSIRLREWHGSLNSLIDYLRVHYSHFSHSCSVRWID